jgi:hypothetical protein
MADSFKSRNTLTVNGSNYTYYRLDTVKGSEKLPFSCRWPNGTQRPSLILKLPLPQHGY